MRAYELIAMMRSRLRDDAAEGWSDNELKDAINFSLYAIAHKLMLWKARWNFTTVIGVDSYSIPEDFMAPIFIIYNGNPIPIRGIEWSLSNGNNEDLCAFIDNNTLILSHIPSGEVPCILNYHALSKIESTGDILNIPYELTDAVLYYALSLSLQKEANEQSLAQSKYYLSLFEDRCKDTANIASKRRGSKTIKSSFQKV